jgi:hypothetical protein
LFIEEGVELKGGRRGATIRISGATSSVTMTGGLIANNNAAGNLSHAPVFISGAGSTFTMSGGEISGNRGPSAGAVSVYTGGARFYMRGGVIRNNYATNSATDNTGGGVSVRSAGIFEKTGGIIYGLDAQGSGNWNRINANPSPPDLHAGNGYAVFVEGTPPKFRDNTSNVGDNKDASKAGSAGGWE